MQARPTSKNLPERRFRSLPVQLKYTMLMTLAGGLTALVMIFVMAWFIQRNYNLFMGDELGVSAQVVEIVRREQRFLETSLFLLFLFSVTALFGISLYVTRRLTGPLFAIQRHLWLFSRGDWSRDFRLRKGDEFKELEAIINAVRQEHINSTQSKRNSDIKEAIG
jgi:HAMP domain-containing protein